MITSVQNNKVKQWNKLKLRKERKKSNAFLIEGYHLVQEACKSNWEVQEIVIQEGIELPEWITVSNITIVSDHVFNAISTTKTPQGIAAVVEMKQAEWGDFSKLLLIDTVQDPGNLGTIVRTADAARFDGVILGDGTVDLYNEKVIRATQGSLFHLPIFERNLKATVEDLKHKDFSIWASTLEGAETYHTMEVPKKIALIVGNEGSGIDEALIDQANNKVHIPIYGKAESLNVSVATGILIYYIANNDKN
ncbi:TrmH family RNA methyltransferase [Aquibacillus rhizosphaerae]|uniref:RNA methyltransferase n=1 Tax=Aquibacillus rhizosphaerae TaxID=3051431 RepID=A0ABT7L430_9BACI|nr:RNA methyltransferase [Aquibacillus sp. LR5S19]MDL4840631.1 RNA methyltransferase [Aquibacillus sp. LR5S19]